MENNSKYIGNGTNMKIIDIYKMMCDGSLVLQPSFQRKLVWNNKHKENFIETILLNYPFPEVYFADGEIDLSNMTSTTLVVDGQQRLNTIYQYITNDPKLKLTRIKRFNQLTEDKQREFLSYNVVVRDLKQKDISEIKEIFRRINSIQYALNAMEINNALYEGEFISIAKEIASSESFITLTVLSENQIARMRDLEFITTIMTTVEIGGYFSSDREVEGFIKKYEDEYPNGNNMKNCFVNVLQYIDSLDLSVDSMWFKKTCMFTLISELLFILFIDNNQLPDCDKCKKMLTEIEKRVMENKGVDTSDKYQIFYNYIYQGTASRTGRNARGELLREQLNKILS